MSDKPIAGHLARYTTSHVAQKAASHHKHTHEMLSMNDELAEDVWFALWPFKPKVLVSVGNGLAARRLSPAQLEHVVKDGRVKLLKSALLKNTLHPAAIELVISSKNAAQLAEAVMDDSDGMIEDPTVRRRLAELAQGVWRIAELRFCDEAEIRASLTTWERWAPRWCWRRTVELSRLAEARPEVIDAFALSEDLELVSIAAGSRHLRDEQLQLRIVALASKELDTEDAKTLSFALLKLVNLPACSQAALEEALKLKGRSSFHEVFVATTRRLKRTDRGTLTLPYEEVEDSEVLSWLLTRAAPTYQDSKPKPLEAEALAHNPHINEEQAFKLACVVQGAYSEVVDAQGTLAVLKDRFGVDLADTHQREMVAEEPPRIIEPERVDYGVLRNPHTAAAWFDSQNLSEKEWDCVFSIADANPTISGSDLVALARALAVT
jgi:hypothetical protein